MNSISNSETIIKEARLHWAMFLWPGLITLVLFFVHPLFGVVVGLILLVPKLVKYMTTVLIISTKRIHGKYGVINVHQMDSPINKISDIAVSKGLMGGLLNYGTLSIRTMSGTYLFKGIGDPETIKNTIIQAGDELEESRFERQSMRYESAIEKQTMVQSAILGHVVEQLPSNGTPQQGQPALARHEEVQRIQMNSDVEVQKPRERVVRKKIEKPLWIKGCPITLSQCIIADKNHNGDIDLNLEIQNLASKGVEAVYLDIQGFNVLKEEKCFLKSVPLLDLSIRSVEKKEIDRPVDLPDNSIRRVKIFIRHVVFSDETIWDYDGDSELFEIADEQEPIRTDYQRDLDKLCKQVTAHGYPATMYAFYPVFREDYWICACGQLNTGHKCLKCDEDMELIKDNIKKEILERMHTQRLIEDEADKARRIAEEEIQRKKLEEEEWLRKEQEEAARLVKEEERRQKIEKLQTTAKGIVDIAEKKGREAGSKFSRTIDQAKKQAGNFKEKTIRQAEQVVTATSGCPQCGTSFEVGDKFCMNCGASLPLEGSEEVDQAFEDATQLAEVYRCVKCGSENEEEAQFCIGCGASLKK